MVLGALIDLGANCNLIKDALISISKFIPNVENFDVECKKISKQGISSTQVQFIFKENELHRHGKDLLNIMENISEKLDWAKIEKELALNILKTLIDAEAKIHGTSPDHVHLHEAGSIDTIMDIIGFVIACRDLKLLENCLWFSTPVAIGGGTLKFSHGLVSNPTPAIAEIFKKRKFEIVGGPTNTELTTPTGASILVNIAQKSIEFYPPIYIDAIGYGAGIKDFSDIPNVLKIIKGRQRLPNPFQFERIITIETNVDDVTGELIGNTIDKIRDSGFTKDISVISTSSKKRPGYLIKILAIDEYLLPITQILINELGTLGVRFFPAMRYTLNRKNIVLSINILNKKYNINVKLSWDSNNNLIQHKPEADEILNLSKITKVPMRELIQKIDIELEKRFPLGKKLNGINQIN